MRSCRFRRRATPRSRWIARSGDRSVAARVRVFAVNRGGESFDRAEEELPVLFGRAAEVFDVVFELVGHQVEGVAQLAQLGAAANLDALREVAARDAVRALGQRGDGPRQLTCEDVADEQSEGRREQTDVERLPSHVADRLQGGVLVLNGDDAEQRLAVEPPVA